MNETCPNCGAELYAGQQFCRRCGTPVSVAVGGEAPTQIFQDGEQVGSAAPVAAGTSRLGEGARTEGVAGQRPTEYQHHSGQQTSVLVGQPFGSRPLSVGGSPPAPKRRRGVWLFALLAVFVLGAGIASALAFFFVRAARTGTVVRVVKTGPPPAPPDAPPVPDVPEIPADLGARIEEAMKALKGHGIPLPLDESEAVVSGDDTTLTRTFEINSDLFKAHFVAGNVTVVGADDADNAVVKIVKHGGSVQERAATRVLAGEFEEGVVLMSAATPGGRVSVSYEITVPREGLRKLELSAQKGDIKVSGFDGELDLNLTNGSASIDARGAVRSRVANGRTSVTYTGGHDEPQEFSVVNGDLEVSLPGEVSVDLKAASVNGRIEVDGALPLKAEKRGPGQRLEGELGGGGAPLNVKVVNGNIRIKQ
ncbi:MAG TPA: zinc-ribbon domain-containing protein [Pyrinomonadaceae bacterium]